MPSEIAISIESISKVFKRYAKPTDRLKEILLPGKQRADEFWALKNIDLKIPKGQTVGLIGQNGSGKSTILQIVAGVLKPTSGRVWVNGTVSALLELGSGFNFEYTGRQNVFFYAQLLGLTKSQVESKFHEIEQFAEIGDFIDQPIKTYSSGMTIRLAFAVATQVNAEILIIDEALSVGDMYFQAKCIERMKEMKQKTTILFVSHSISTVRNFCDRAIWIKSGEIAADGECSVVCESYQDSIGKLKKSLGKNNRHVSDNVVAEDAYVFIKKVATDKKTYMSGEDIEIEIQLDFFKKLISWGVGILIHNSSGDIVTVINTIRDDIEIQEEHNNIYLKIEKNQFIRDEYFLSISIVDNLALCPFAKLDYCTSFFVEIQKNKFGIPVAEGFFRTNHHWSFS
ncbi:ABC transporter ATP-binding protein [Almyronema epifaneia]|uniref:Polysaccharide ABC transporter ATP-binding protein n=1 Tax=Almyronema epifaneia S1 TaxID=2991925 RepID=A0ABW6IAN8_9CYAN